jgi:hypothetical protein
MVMRTDASVLVNMWDGAAFAQDAGATSMFILTYAVEIVVHDAF